MDRPLDTLRIDHASEHGRWTLVRRRPSPPLAAYVHELQGYVETGGRPVRRMEVPSVVVPLIVNCGAPFRLHDPGAPQRWRPLASFVAGLHERPAMVGSQGNAFCMQVDFSPLGARRFLGIDLAAIAGEVVALDAVLGGWAGRLAERLHDAPGWTARLDLLEAAVAERMAAGRPAPAPVAAAWRAIETSGGSLAIGSLAARLDCSRKHLHDAFRRAVGLAPKRVARILRFERALAALAAPAAPGLADLALACGYYDQAHFNRDFRAFAGESPSALRSRMLPDGSGILAAG